MKVLLPFLFMFLACVISAQSTVEVNPSIMASASKYSTSGEIGVFLLAGNEYDSLTDEEINEKFDVLMEKYDVGIEFFIQRTDLRNSSSYVLFMDEESIGPSVNKKGLKDAILKAIDIHKNNRR